MNNRHRILTSAMAATIAATLGTQAAQAADVYMRAESFSRALPGVAAPVTMWGYKSCTDGTFAVCDAVASSPGPEIVVPPGDSSLTIHLYNGLAEPTSVMIPGQTKPMAPVTFTPAGDTRARIRAFDKEVAPGSSDSFTWSNLRPGTYLYQSASHVQLQVHMGLYGAMSSDAATGEVYVGVPYAQARTVIFSEVDPSLHSPPKAANLTVDGYRPSVFLINGQSFGFTDPVPVTAVPVSNPGFEDPDCGGGGTCVVNALGNYTNGTATGWTITGAGGAGVFDPVSAIVPTEGDQVGWSSGSTLAQVLTESLQANQTYTLTVDVGDRSDMAFPGYTVGLYAGGTLLVEQVGTAASVTSGWASSTVTYAAGATPPPGALEIRLKSAGSQAEFDNVRLVKSPIVATPGPLVTATIGQRVLLRLLNAGLQNRAPQLLGGHFEIVGEDGHRSPVSHLQYNTLLPAGKALDVVFTPAAPGTYTLYDRRLGLSNGTGQLGHIVVTP